MVRAIFEHASRSGLIPINPAKGVRTMVGRRRMARLSMEQLLQLGRAMRDAEDENPTGLAAIRLMALTGLRRQEALGIKPAWILDAGGISFPDTKSGAQVRPIGKAAIKLLRINSRQEAIRLAISRRTSAPATSSASGRC